MDIFFFRSSRFRQYLRENLRILEAGDDERIRVHYPRQAVQDDLLGLDLQGAPALFILSDPPHQRRAPVRHGRILAVHDEGERIEFELRLTAFASASLDCSAFDDWARQQPACCEQQAMVFRPDAPLDISEPSRQQGREDNWRAAIDRLLASDSADHYAESVFLLPAGLRDEEEDQLVDPSGLSTGRVYIQTLQVYAPQLSEEDRARCSLGLGLDRTELELLQAPTAIPARGELQLSFRPLVPGSARMNVHVRPQSERSSRPGLEYHASGAEIQQLFSCQEVAGESVREGLRSLLALLRKQGALQDPEQGAALLDHLLQLAPDDAELRRNRARMDHHLERHAQAAERYRELGATHLAPEDWLPYFLSACHSGSGAALLSEALDHLPWDGLELEAVRRVGVCLASRGEGLILDLLEPLAYYASQAFPTELWPLLRQQIRSRDGLLKALAVLKETHMDKAESAFSYLLERSQAEEISDGAIDANLVELGLELAQLPRPAVEALLRHSRHLLDQGQRATVLTLLERARPRMNAGAFEQLRSALAEQLMEDAQAESLELAGMLLCEAADAARLRGDLDEATWLLERAALAHPETERLDEVQRALEKSVNALEDLQLLGEALFGQRLKALRKRLAGKRLVIAGGSHEKPWAEELRQELSLADVVWHPSQLGKPPRVDKLKESLNDTVGAVAVLVFYAGHRTADVAKDESRKRQIPFAPVTQGTSKDALLRALLKATEDAPRGSGE